MPRLRSHTVILLAFRSSCSVLVCLITHRRFPCAIVSRIHYFLIVYRFGHRVSFHSSVSFLGLGSRGIIIGNAGVSSLRPRPRFLFLLIYLGLLSCRTCLVLV